MSSEIIVYISFQSSSFEEGIIHNTKPAFHPFKPVYLIYYIIHSETIIIKLSGITILAAAMAVLAAPIIPSTEALETRDAQVDSLANHPQLSSSTIEKALSSLNAPETWEWAYDEHIAYIRR